jgi:hypothetical protein
MAPLSEFQKILDQQVSSLATSVTSLAISVSTHHAEGAALNEKVDKMYKVLVTGNGQPALPEIVRRHDEWIMERDKERAEKSESAKIDRREAVSFKRQIWLMLATEIVGFCILAVEVAIHMK